MYYDEYRTFWDPLYVYLNLLGVYLIILGIGLVSALRDQERKRRAAVRQNDGLKRNSEI